MHLGDRNRRRCETAEKPGPLAGRKCPEAAGKFTQLGFGVCFHKWKKLTNKPVHGHAYTSTSTLLWEPRAPLHDIPTPTPCLWGPLSRDLTFHTKLTNQLSPMCSQALPAVDGGDPSFTLNPPVAHSKNLGKSWPTHPGENRARGHSRLPAVIRTYSNQIPSPQSLGDLTKLHHPVTATTQQTVSPKERAAHALVWDSRVSERHVPLRPLRDTYPRGSPAPASMSPRHGRGPKALVTPLRTVGDTMSWGALRLFPKGTEAPMLTASLPQL